MRNYVCVHARALERTRLRLYSALLSRMHFIRSPCIRALPSEHTARTPLDSAALGAGAAGAWPVAASRLRDSQAVGAPAARRRDGSELRLTSAQSSVWSIGSPAARNRDAIRQVAAASDPPLPHRPRSEISRDEPRSAEISRDQPRSAEMRSAPPSPADERRSCGWPASQLSLFGLAAPV